jgi:hypothetical protein
MKIIKNNLCNDCYKENLCNDTSVQVECTGYNFGRNGCGSILLVDDEDIIISKKHLSYIDYDVFQFICPLCNARTDLREIGYIPKAVRDRRREALLHPYKEDPKEVARRERCDEANYRRDPGM